MSLFQALIGKTSSRARWPPVDNNNDNPLQLNSTIEWYILSDYPEYVLSLFPIHKFLTMKTSSPTHSSLFYICSLWFVVLFLEAEDMTEADPRTSTSEL